MIPRIRTRTAAVLAAVGLLLASLGGAGAVGLATASAGTQAHAAKKHHKKKHTVKKRGCIPQTAVHTDNDPDNHGGPNDGDGCF